MNRHVRGIGGRVHELDRWLDGAFVVLVALLTLLAFVRLHKLERYVQKIDSHKPTVVYKIVPSMEPLVVWCTEEVER